MVISPVVYDSLMVYFSMFSMSICGGNISRWRRCGESHACSRIRLECTPVKLREIRCPFKVKLACLGLDFAIEMKLISRERPNACDRSWERPVAFLFIYLIQFYEEYLCVYYTDERNMIIIFYSNNVSLN